MPNNRARIGEGVTRTNSPRQEPKKIATYKKGKQGEGNYTHLLNNRVNYTNALTPLFSKNKKLQFALFAASVFSITAGLLIYYLFRENNLLIYKWFSFLPRNGNIIDLFNNQ
jgi:hypothetical protein